MDLENRPVAFENLVFERQEQISREYDRQFIEGALVSDLNISLIKKVSNQITNMSPEKCLQYLGLAEYGVGMLKLKRACLLLFANDISRWHPRCQVRVLRIRGTELKTGLDYNVVSDEIANGNVLEIINSAWEKLRPHLVETKMDNDALFRVRVMYPEHACREALINAISHRDYSLEGQNIEIYIYDDRIEVKSPGGLLSGIKIEDLKKMQGIHESRNANIARTLRELGYMQEMGEGIRRIFCLMQDADLIPPDLIADKNRFSIVLHHKSVFSDKDQRLLDGYKQFKLTKEEKLIILLGKEGNLLTSQQIYDELDLKDWDVFRKIVEQIQIKGILYNKISQSKKALLAREQKVSKRKIPRLQVRQPESVENALNEVITIFREQERVKVVDNNYLKNIFNSLPENNLYRKYFPNLSRLLIILGFITKNRKPTTKLLEIWDK
jgi:ATP-dependent DNA helicase RecG